MQLCLALDLDSKRACLDLLESLKGFKLLVKVGLRAFVREGPSFIKEIQNMGFKIFLDLKLHDIPNTMASAVLECAHLGVELLTLHASSGAPALLAVMEQVQGLKQRPKILGVTLLTSLDEAQCQSLYNAPLEQHALHLAKLCYESGLDGVVCSVFESLVIKEATNPKFLTLTPGIRPNLQEVQDQKRVGSLQDAKTAKADFIVIGRPIYQAKDPKETTAQILESLEHANL
ncbi:Orotidine 5'-phosphate decarboxylase PyrF [Helicobacter sp. NHP19-012]|uniref:Orotidine 5'-phosphate decarboxylase n=1 Tax=Helicobacter gastrofelis TaxID=2849642 RepID=A0ABM7SMQ1_9HELI|nr:MULTISPECIES: orotidine-5'-phosphate decarboxylase [unclassified Helicobacter]BCZ18839.1 Orotidine 5'-phosphate decarboxylase PyrF [Helicobacter sp. NHP19-012]GMB96250.1 Orotidine 5'-phosphate decarboxylase PyrF [Helicobacter sp. NHP22-001]